MKTLMMTTALALALGFSTGATAETLKTGSLTKMTTLEMISPMEFSVTEASDFYQGDYLRDARSDLNSLAQDDLYTGKGASESVTLRWVT